MARLEPFFPKSDDKPHVDDRRELCGIIFINRGLTWRDIAAKVPRIFGSVRWHRHKVEASCALFAIYESNGFEFIGRTTRLVKRNGPLGCLYDGSEAEAFLCQGNSDLIVMDISLSGKSGLEVLRSLRSHGDASLLVMACDATDDKIAGPDLGAKDYLTKPFDLAELRERARALMRRSDKQIETTVEVGTITLNLTSRILAVAGKLLTCQTRVQNS